MARTVQSFFCLGRSERCLPGSLKEKGAVGLYDYIPACGTCRGNVFTSFRSRASEFLQSFITVFSSFLQRLGGFGRFGFFPDAILRPFDKSRKTEKSALASYDIEILIALPD